MTVPAQTSQPLLNTTVGGQLRAQAARFPDRPALTWAVAGDPETIEVMTYRELLRAAEAAAVVIARHAGPGDRVAVWAANAPEWVIVEYGSAHAGTVLTSMNPALTDGEAGHALSLTSPSVLFAGTDNRGADLNARAASLGTRCATIDLATVATHPASVSFNGPRVSPDDPFIIQLTSGTTGRAKGATLSHRAALNGGYVRALTVQADESDVWLNPVPLHHMSGAVVMVNCALSSGGCYVVVSRFDPAAQVALMHATGATRTGGVPTMLYGLLDTPGGAEAMARVKSVGLGGTIVPAALVEKIQSYGATVSVAYAQSECPMITQSDPLRDARHVADTVGIPVPHTELRIVGSDGSIVHPGEVGEVCVRSPLTMLGYWNMPEATREVLDVDGFLHTGDLGALDDDGVLRINGRKREVIIRGGENIYPAEVENALLRHPAVDAVAVIGTPSERWGQEVGAVVKLVAASAATAEELTDHTANVLAHFKVPRHWRFVDEMPMTASGKIRKVELATLFKEPVT